MRFLQKMLIDAINARASDLHFEPYEYHYRVRFRIDGELREITQPPIAIKDVITSYSIHYTKLYESSTARRLSRRCTASSTRKWG